MLEGIIAGSAAVFSLSGFLYLIIGMLIGILVGVLPGVGPSLGMALLIPFTYNMVPADAMILLISVYVGAEYGGSITSILIAVPGNGAAAATVLDGYPMAKQGKAALALEISLTASCVGGVLGGICLLLFLQPLAGMALRFGPPAYFAVSILALSAVGALGGKSPILGLLSAAIGLGIATIGVDPITSVERFTFGLPELDEGIPAMVAIIGLFAVAEMIDALQQKASGGLAIAAETVGRTFLSLKQWRELLPSMFRGSLVGVGTGILPGLGSTVGSWIAYDVERRVSKTPEQFGKGAPAGVSGPEAANNSAVGGQLIPLLALGLPSSPSTAVLASALILHGLQPGPALMLNAPSVAYGLIVTVIFSVAVLYVMGNTMVPFWARVARVPESIMVAVVLALCIIGAYSVRNLVFDIWLAVGFGVLGYAMKLLRLPVAPMVLSLVIFELVEGNFRRSLMIARGNYSIFISDPLSASFLTLSALVILWPFASKYFRKLRQAKA
ncbi:MAG: protein of unknown function transrane [Devosia sp.]|nr:protein of unknown function transrane [Devosia sp.]